MTRFEHFGRDSVHDRDLFLAAVARADDLSLDLRLPSRYFACLLAWDATGVAADVIRAVGKTLIDQGAAYFCVWGPDCERVHDLIDEVELLRTEANPDDDSLVLTDWYQDQPLAEAIWAALYCACPDEKFLEECKSTVAISIGSPDWAVEIRAAFTDPKKFSDELLSANE